MCLRKYAQGSRKQEQEQRECTEPGEAREPPPDWAGSAEPLTRPGMEHGTHTERSFRGCAPRDHDAATGLQSNLYVTQRCALELRGAGSALTPAALRPSHVQRVYNYPGENADARGRNHQRLRLYSPQPKQSCTRSSLSILAEEAGVRRERDMQRET